MAGTHVFARRERRKMAGRWRSSPKSKRRRSTTSKSFKSDSKTWKCATPADGVRAGWFVSSIAALGFRRRNGLGHVPCARTSGVAPNSKRFISIELMAQEAGKGLIDFITRRRAEIHGRLAGWRPRKREAQVCWQSRHRVQRKTPEIAFGRTE
jgi:hypothetical protein